VFSKHTQQPIKKVYADKGYAGQPNQSFLATNKIADGIMRKDSTTAKLTEWEIERNKKIFTPLNLFCVLFNWGSKATSLAQLNKVPFGKFNRVKTILWHQSSEGRCQKGQVYATG
jgi:hypothetical protein